MSPWHGVVQPALVEKLKNMLEAKTKSSLKPSQKITMLRIYAMPRLIYEADHGGVGQETLRVLDGMPEKYFDWHSDDEITKRITRRVIKPTEFTKLWMKAGGSKDEAPMLEGGGGNGQDRANTEALNTTGNKRVVTPSAERAAKSCPNFPERRNNGFLRWMGLEVQGMGIQVFHGDKITNHWLAEPTEAGFRQRHYIANLLFRANVYPTLEATSRGRLTITVACRRCGDGSETGPHILGQCHAVKDSRIKGHHKLCKLLADEAESAGWSVIEEMVCSTPSGAQRRPDLVFVKDGLALVVDVTVRFEVAPDTREKMARYKPVIPFVLEETGASSAKVMGFPLGGRGKWHPANESLLKQLGIGPKKRAREARLVSRSLALAWPLHPSECWGFLLSPGIDPQP
ncbi:hypothetical protein DPEC_G00331580 [Dallia pectoralis]|uniref:Uncharacterized protein n=1 Tax=Dallia pectoralis TaxID=75939 RepID=A0ACC2F690_DALPE|nr:hypothetical protein DPEC_G00331580 [Dallia pectoralis]